MYCPCCGNMVDAPEPKEILNGFRNCNSCGKQIPAGVTRDEMLLQMCETIGEQAELIENLRKLCNSLSVKVVGNTGQMISSSSSSSSFADIALPVAVAMAAVQNFDSFDDDIPF